MGGIREHGEDLKKIIEVLKETIEWMKIERLEYEKMKSQGFKKMEEKKEEKTANANEGNEKESSEEGRTEVEEEAISKEKADAAIAEEIEEEEGGNEAEISEVAEAEKNEAGVAEPEKKDGEKNNKNTEEIEEERGKESKKDEEEKEGKEKEGKVKSEKKEEKNVTGMVEVTQGGEEKKSIMGKMSISLGQGELVITGLGSGHHITRTSNPSVEGRGVNSGGHKGLNNKGPNQSNNLSGENSGGGTGLRDGLNNRRGPNQNNLIKTNVQVQPNTTNDNLGHNREREEFTLGTLTTNGGGVADRSSATYRRLTVAEMADRWDVDSTCKHMWMVRNKEKTRYTGEYEGIKGYKKFVDPSAAKQNIQEQGASIVINADGLAVGKGVTVSMTLEEAYEAVNSMLVKSDFGSAGCSVIIEEFLKGAEVSFLARVDGENVIPLESTQDHKQVGEGDTGPNPFRLTMGLRGLKQWDPGGNSSHIICPFFSP